MVPLSHRRVTLELLWHSFAVGRIKLGSMNVPTEYRLEGNRDAPIMLADMMMMIVKVAERQLPGVTESGATICRVQIAMDSIITGRTYVDVTYITYFSKTKYIPWFPYLDTDYLLMGQHTIKLLLKNVNWDHLHLEYTFLPPTLLKW